MASGEAAKPSGQATNGAPSNKFLRWQIVSQALVVALAVVAFTVCTKFVLDAYKGCDGCDSGTPAAAASSNASSVVAVMTPIAAGIVGIVGLFFGISGTGSARGRQAGAEAEAAASYQSDVAKQQAEAARQQAEAVQELAAAAEGTRPRKRRRRI